VSCEKLTPTRPPVGELAAGVWVISVSLVTLPGGKLRLTFPDAESRVPPPGVMRAVVQRAIGAGYHGRADALNLHGNVGVGRPPPLCRFAGIDNVGSETPQNDESGV
jgi:hypothetical protein